MSNPPTTPELRRSIGVVQATALVAGTILGAAIFVQPSEIGRHVPTVTGMMAVWLLCGLLTLCGALVCAELAAVFPRSGGVYVFLRETFSPALGFLWGWAMFWSMHSGIIGAIAVVFARYAGYIVPMSSSGERAVAIGGILLLSAVNYTGVRAGGAVQAVLTGAKLLAVVALLALAFALSPGEAAPFAQAGSPPSFSLREFVLAMSAGLFAYGGWHMVTYPAEETRDPRRTIPRALILGTLIVTACYVGLNAAYLHVLPVERVATSTRVAADAAETLVGPGAGVAISALVMVSAFGAMNGIILAGPRVYYAMARDGLLFPWMGAVHPRFQSPHIAITVQALWSCVLVATGTYRELFTRVIYTEWIFFALLAVGLIRVRRRNAAPGARAAADAATGGVGNATPGFRLWGYPWVPVAFIAASLIIVANQIASDPRSSALGLLLVAAGLPVYYFWARRT